MKKCTHCGKEQPDEATTCPVDGQPLESVVTLLTQRSPEVEVKSAPVASQYAARGLLVGTILGIFYGVTGGIHSLREWLFFIAPCPIAGALLGLLYGCGFALGQRWGCRDWQKRILGVFFLLLGVAAIFGVILIVIFM
jgi:hypothetical protein